MEQDGAPNQFSISIANEIRSEKNWKVAVKKRKDLHGTILFVTQSMFLDIQEAFGFVFFEGEIYKI